jgi:pimeloyl-ACP methyl ester carboxylesterase
MYNSKNTINLRDGRKLCYYEYGDPQGSTVMYFHGGGSNSGLYAATISEAAAISGIRLISPDRPGIGFSDFKQNRTLLDWPYDVEELANILGVQLFSIVSESAGSAYAYACAYKIPHRLLKVGIVSGLCPLDSKYLKEGLSFKNRLVLHMLKKSPNWILKKIKGHIMPYTPLAWRKR